MRLRLLAVLAVLAQILIGFSAAAPAAANSSLATTFFSDGFETGAFGSSWTPSVTYNGVAEVNGNYPHGGGKSAFLGQKVAGNASASLVLALDLSGQSDVFLDFWARGTNNGTRTVSISDNGGTNWKQILDLSAASQSFSHQVIDIASVATANGLTLNSQFRISFDYSAIYFNQAGDGFVIDDVRVTQHAQEIASFPYAQDSFETGFHQGFYPQSTNNGVAEISTNYPHTGASSIFLGQKIVGSASASLVLAVDLTGQTDVFLDFWARGTNNGTRTVSISDDGGTTWNQILDLSAASQSFSHQVIDIASVATVNGLTLNSQFRISFDYSAIYFNKAGDGFVIDDVRLTQRAQEVATFPYAQDSFETGFHQGFYPQSTNNGVAEISTNYPHTGASSIFLGQKIAGSAGASLVIVLDLTGQTDVLLDFWARGTNNGIRTVSISDSGGSTWKQALDISSISQNFNHYVLNISDLAVANGLALNSQFRISFDYGAVYFNKAGDGLVIDDLKLVHTSL
ncbi:hypothetical protein K2Z83_00085, partial [Oscillochloris sp. ZM17-4]|uniref:hypothetical protein n=1 Tax=Oscillochloris sp. ZM17-4 TaxID=2866714 RepID=UPI001C736EB4